jgi:hypothetical protein
MCGVNRAQNRPPPHLGAYQGKGLGRTSRAALESAAPGVESSVTLCSPRRGHGVKTMNPRKPTGHPIRSV